ncbi:hypothetical protein [Halalkalibacter okhensis]|uniref:Uncharacterized protein n=1 Tax=Halalkalibacter okhensis TaxID=333138 RepID=A0A0B0IJZ8_9BACI|nr:hypothetical protein [Halalkalibacter okhensis]KHF41655.1 hypothetical protein LQ50_02850 [Halalkalibacter okhensis]
MNEIVIKELRKKQFLTVNLLIIAYFAIIAPVISILDASRLTVLLVFIVFMGISCFHTWRELGGKKSHLFAWTRQLAAYEKEKLGREWVKSKQTELTSKLFLIVLFGFQLLLANPREPFIPLEIGLSIWLLFLLALLLLMNISLYFRNRKIDRLSTNELQGFTKKENGIGLIVGVMLSIVIVFTILFLVSR